MGQMTIRLRTARVIAIQDMTPSFSTLIFQKKPCQSLFRLQDRL